MTIQVILNSNNQLITTSKNVGDVFGKNNKNVMQAIRNLDCSDEFRGLNFNASSYLSKQNKTLECIEMTFDGFVFLCMGFTGKKASQFKESYIKEFNHMKNICERIGKVDIQDKLQEVETQDKITAIQEQALVRKVKHRLDIANMLNQSFDINQFLENDINNVPAHVIMDMKLAMGGEIATYGSLSLPHKTITHLLDKHDIDYTAKNFNELLVDIGLLTSERVVTNKGLHFGFNRDEGTHTQPRWFVDRFPELLNYMKDELQMSL